MSNYLIEGLKDLKVKRLDAMFMKVMHEIGDRYVIGTINYIENHHKALDAEIDETDKKINEILHLCNEGEATEQDFKRILKKYKRLYLQAINLYRKRV